jgi:hypothetical protein
MSRACIHGQQVELHTARAQIIEQLVDGAVLAALDLLQPPHGPQVEVGHAPAGDHPLVHQLLEGGDGLFQRNPAFPVQQIEVQPVGPQPFQRLFAGQHHLHFRGVLGPDLGDQKYLVAPPGDDLAHQPFGTAVAVELGRVDQGQAQVDSPRQSLLLLIAPGGVVAQFPGALAQGGNGRTVCECDEAGHFRPVL